MREKKHTSTKVRTQLLIKGDRVQALVASPVLRFLASRFRGARANKKKKRVQISRAACSGTLRARPLDAAPLKSLLIGPFSPHSA